MPDTDVTAERREAARSFTLDDVVTEITCPWCFETISISGGHVFTHRSQYGTPLNHEGDATLGDLIDAANAHVCDGDDSDG